MLNIGEIINDTYFVEEKIGFGASGVVYKAYHLRLKKHIVIKQIKSELIGKINERCEVDILKNIKHRYIPQVYDFIEQDGEVYTVIEYISGLSLADELKKRKRFPQKRVIKWAIQLCEALSYLHSRSIPIIHSDIKPANIMLNKEDDICLIDFNISLLFSDDFSTVGFTEGYSPPEQISVFNVLNRMDMRKIKKLGEETELLENINVLKPIDYANVTFAELNSGNPNNRNSYDKDSKINIRHRINEKSDIYSLGASLYHLLYGEKYDSSSCDIISYNRNSFKIDTRLYQIIKKATYKEPENRYQSANEMLYDLNKIGKKESVFSIFKRV